MFSSQAANEPNRTGKENIIIVERNCHKTIFHSIDKRFQAPTTFPGPFLFDNQRTIIKYRLLLNHFSDGKQAYTSKIFHFNALLSNPDLFI